MEQVLEFFETIYDKLEVAGVNRIIENVYPYVFGVWIGVLIMHIIEWWESGLKLKEFILRTMFVYEEDDNKEDGKIDRA